MNSVTFTSTTTADFLPKIDNFDIYKFLDIEIYELTELLEALNGGVLLGEDENLEGDMKTIKQRLDSLKDARSMIYKASMQIKGLDNILTMSAGERKWFFRVVKFISWFRFKK